MTDREKLTELVKDVLDYLPWGQISSHTAKEIADHLVENGVTFATDNNVGHWIPVAERLPERTAEVLVCDARENYVSIWGHIDGDLWFGNEVVWATEDITHWMPLPEPPKEVE